MLSLPHPYLCRMPPHRSMLDTHPAHRLWHAPKHGVLISTDALELLLDQSDLAPETPLSCLLVPDDPVYVQFGESVVDDGWALLADSGQRIEGAYLFSAQERIEIFAVARPSAHDGSALSLFHSYSVAAFSIPRDKPTAAITHIASLIEGKNTTAALMAHAPAIVQHLVKFFLYLASEPEISFVRPFDAARYTHPETTGETVPAMRVGPRELEALLLQSIGGEDEIMRWQRGSLWTEYDDVLENTTIHWARPGLHRG